MTENEKLDLILFKLGQMDDKFDQMDNRLENAAMLHKPAYCNFTAPGFITNPRAVYYLW